MRAVAALLAAALLAGCAGAGPGPTPAASPPRAASPAELGGWFDCLRERREAVVSAHRGGPAPGFPENSLAAMARTLDAVPGALLEIDVQQSRDGVLILFHDDRLDRKSTGSGAVQATDWADIAKLRLRDRDGQVTDAAVPKLAEGLRLIVSRGAVAQLDVKRGVDLAAVVDAVGAANAAGHVIIITYTDADALALARLAPDLMQSATVRDAGQAERLIAGGVRRDRLLAWTGTRAPDIALFAALRAAGVEPIFGTLGSGPDSLDQQWLADGDGREFVQLERDGAVLIATNRAAAVTAALGPVSCRRQATSNI